MDSIGLYILVIILVAMSAVFSGTETAFSSANRIRLKNLANEGNKRAKLALQIIDNFDKMLTAVLIGNNIVNIASASIGTVICTQWFGTSGPAWSTLIMTLIVLTFGEILPKSFAKEHAEGVALRMAFPLHVLIKAFTPLVWFFINLKKLVTRKKTETTPSVTEEELKYIIEEIEDEGVLESSESELVQSALDFDETSVDEIITHRVDMDAVEVSKPLEELKELFFNSTHSRIPVYEKKIDNIIGIVHQRDFFKALLKDGTVDLRKIMQEVFFVPTTLNISELMQEFQKRKCHVAIVTDQYGGVVGLATFEDILEELVGDIWDESDEVEQELVKLGHDHYRINGDMYLRDFFEEIDYEPDDKFDYNANTVGGFVLELFERIPEKGETFDYDRFHFTVGNVEEQRILYVEVFVDPAPEEELL